MSGHVYPTINDTEFVTREYRVQELPSSSCSAAAPSGVISSTEVCTSQRYRAASGVRTPGWKRMMNEGVLLPMTPWDRIEIDARLNVGTRHWCDLGNNQHYAYLPHAWCPNDIALVGDWHFVNWMSYVGELDFQYYVQKAAAAIYSSGWDALTFIAELKQLRRMLSGIGTKLDRLAKGRNPGELHDLWLEGRYGWRTLMYDIRDLHGALAQANARRTRYREAKGFTSSGSWDSGIFTHNSAIIAKWSSSLSWTANLRGTVVADIDIPDFQFNPVTTAWEVTKLSFVLDWLLNVGQALEAASFLLMVKDYRACGGYRVDFDVDGSTWLDGVSSSLIVDAVQTGSYRGTVTIIKRVPTSVSAYPRMKLRLDEFKIIDLLALIRQRL